MGVAAPSLLPRRLPVGVLTAAVTGLETVDRLDCWEPRDGDRGEPQDRPPEDAST